MPPTLLIFFISAFCYCLARLLRLQRAMPGRARGQRTLLVVAHPDDESLFFASYLADAAHAGRQVHVLCLSTGEGVAGA
ncbi:hypothetical protein TSOC_008489 [Tetrabaena socialis]|uniref:N-acetylglucosaminylphosphatidylinositol deacetylase n=1 Tax=Tetrabaena socialis TaxID=47790 RepID=A0A2J7ZYC0_9CHLO|nr:hypothetical protein TSOC_008489 [Tetrabaena socialis]|eukprot:PNH05262.1 hypothetical protein TSOC_008489 [Tetrabaena socialis]